MIHPIPLKTIISISLLLTLYSSRAQNTDLPTPVANIQTLPSGSYVIAMDNTNQLNNGNDFNIKAYGLIVHLLNNNAKVHWVITAGKVKDAIDFTVNATKFKPVSGTATSLNFRSGPFVIFATDTTGVAALIDGFNSGISNSNDKIKVYRTNASVSVDVRYDLTGFVPKAAILDDGSNSDIHEDYMTACNITTTNYRATPGTSLLTDCYTFASESHNNKSGISQDNAIIAVKRFVEFGGNFLAQCEAIATYENSSYGHFQTTSGISDANSNAGTNISYPYPDLSFSQFEGAYDISIGGSLKNWRINATGINSFHKQAKGSSDTTVMGASVAKLRSGIGGLVFYIGNHKFNNFTKIEEINGLRMYMNAFLTPVTVARYCEIGDPYMNPLSTKLISFDGSQEHENISLKWEVMENENQKKFEIERSETGFEFSSVSGTEASIQPGKVSYLGADRMPANKTFYRLKITGKNNVVNYSRVLLFQSNADDNDVIRVTNQPVSDRMEISFTSSRSGNYEIRVFDMLGKQQLGKTVTANAGTNKFQLSLPYSLPRGIYVAELFSGADRMITKFIKQ